MSFCPTEIACMLEQHEADHDTGMDITAISESILIFTGGYPYLVSRICKHIDEKLDKDWTCNGVNNAMGILFEEKTLLRRYIQELGGIQRLV